MNSRTTALVVALILVLVSYIVEKDSQLARIAENGAEVPASNSHRANRLGNFSDEAEITPAAGTSASEHISESQAVAQPVIGDFSRDERQDHASGKVVDSDGHFIPVADRPDTDMSGVSDTRPDLDFDPSVG